MKVIIFCGGLGTRIGEETKKIPKPMIKINSVPILERIINLFYKYGHNDFILATGYKSKIIENYFNKKKNYNLQCIYTGLKTNTGGRLLKLKNYIKPGEDFFLTYGDGLSNQNLNNLIKFHKQKKKIGTITVVRPPARFGEVTLRKNSLVSNFEEKPKVRYGWINGGFFIFNQNIFKYLKKKNEVFEKTPLERLVKNKELSAFKHEGIWQCMDTQRDKKIISELVKKNKL